ncbi:MAG: DUF1385 domain-containing protein [Chloroflexi bacterium]|nr:DUF1385 domain-containing protein [Chloroflexota bacterium]
MMRGRHQATVAVRKPGGDIILHTEELPAGLYRGRVARLPLVRGLIALWEMLILGTRMMLYSATVHARGDRNQEIPRGLVAGMLAISLTFVVGLFFVLPLLVARLGGHTQSSLASNVIEGVVRLALFVGYLALVGRMQQMKRVFQYHGAEHKTINAYESGAELTPSAVRPFSLIHVRCGTAFLLWVVLFSILVFALLGHPPLLVGIASRIVLVPVIATISYELLRLGARFYHLGPVRIVLQPGLWLQRLTTREPSDDQLEVAIAALKPVLEADGLQVAESGTRAVVALASPSQAAP